MEFVVELFPTQSTTFVRNVCLKANIRVILSWIIWINASNSKQLLVTSSSNIWLVLHSLEILSNFSVVNSYKHCVNIKTIFEKSCSIIGLILHLYALLPHFSVLKMCQYSVY